MKQKVNGKRQTRMMHMIQAVERIGNRMPHPMYIFLYLTIGIMVISAICAAFGVEVTYMKVAEDGTLAETTLKVVNLLSRAELQNFLSNIVTAFRANSLLIPMLIMSFCISIADETGLFTVALRRALRGAPQKVATFMLCLICVCANIAGDAGVILAITFGAILFKAMGRNPWIGITLGYGAIQAGWSANLLPSTGDVVYAGVTGPLAEPYGYTVHAMSNYIFMAVTSVFLALAFTFVAERVLVKLMGDTNEKMRLNREELGSNFEISEADKRGLKFASIGLAAYLIFLVLGVLPFQSFLTGYLCNEQGSVFPKSPFLSGLIPLIGALFLFTAIPFGYGSGKIKSKADIPLLMQKGAVKMASLLFILFPCSLFIYQFNISNLSTLVSILGERFLTSIHLTGLPLLLVFIIVIGLVNVVMYSSTAKWMIMGPIFVPMFINLGIDPAWTQLASRIGDSFTNGLSPLNAGLVAVLALMMQYEDKKFHSSKPGIGTIISSQIPLSIASFAVMAMLFVVFYLFGFPIGIGG